MTANNKLGRMWKNAIMAYFKILSQYLPEKLKKTPKTSVMTISGMRTKLGISLIQSRSANHLTVISAFSIFPLAIFQVFLTKILYAFLVSASELYIQEVQCEGTHCAVIGNAVCPEVGG
jgi:hypothetical protein